MMNLQVVQSAEYRAVLYNHPYSGCTTTIISTCYILHNIARITSLPVKFKCDTLDICENLDAYEIDYKICIHAIDQLKM